MKENEDCMDCNNAKKDFLAYLLSLMDCDSEFDAKILSLVEVRKLHKKEVILKEGEICTEAFWLQCGYGRYFRKVVDKEGLTSEETFDFVKPRKIVFIASSFFNKDSSLFGFELAAGSVIISFSKECYERLKKRNPEIATMVNKIFAMEIEENITKKDILKMKPKERYMEFLAFFGVNIEQYFFIKHIAYNLGLQPSHLSRIRGEYRKKKTGLTKYLQTVFLILQFI